MTTLFISHASHDVVLVEAVVDLLEGGVGVPLRSIFCSSLKGQSIKPGKEFVASIKASLDEATCVLALISEAYYVSAFCMCELGGVWLQSKSFLPVLVPPVDHSNLKAVLGGLQVSKIGSEQDLDELRDELVARLGIEGHPTPRWNTKRKVFLDVLPAILEKSRFSGPVPRATHEKLKQEHAAYQKEYEAREQEIGQLKRMNTDLKKAKDANAVSEVVRKHSSFAETFESLIKAAATALRSLSPPVREALYYRCRNEDYSPKEAEDWDDVKTAIEYGQLRYNAEEDGVTPSDGNPGVRKAMTALDDLGNWLRTAPEEFYAWYTNGPGRGEEPDITLRTFWDRHLR